MYTLDTMLVVIICLPHTNGWESLGGFAAACSLLKAVFILQVMQESVSGTANRMKTSISAASHPRIRIRYLS